MGERLHEVLGQNGSKLCSMATESPHWLTMGKMMFWTFSRFYPILFILAGNEAMHKISDEFEFRPDRTTDYGVSCPLRSKKIPIDLKWENGVSVLVPSSSKLLVTRTGIKAQTSSIWASGFNGPFIYFFKWDLTLAHWTPVCNRCHLGYLFIHPTGRKRVCEIRFVSTGENWENPCLVCKKQFFL